MTRIFILILACFFAATLNAQDETVFILVRHAEKQVDGTKDPSLTEEGKIRAEKLNTLLSPQQLSAIYSTPFKRTRQTVYPLAKSKGLTVKSYNPRPDDEWIQHVFEENKGGTVVIVGHSNTIPYMANRLLGGETFGDFDEGDYSDLIIIVGPTIGKTRLVHLTY